MYCAYCGFALKPPVKRKGCSIQQIILVIILLIILRALSQILSEPPSSSTEPSTGNAAVITATEELEPTPRPTAVESAPSASPADSAPSVDAVVNVPRLNMRAGPGTKYEVVETYSQGTPVQITGKNADASWFQVSVPDGKSGWMSETGLKIEQDVEQIPVVE